MRDVRIAIRVKQKEVDRAVDILWRAYLRDMWDTHPRMYQRAKKRVQQLQYELHLLAKKELYS